MKYVLLLRGINVGGKNRVKMADLRQFLKDLGYERVSTYIQSGNVLLESGKPADAVVSQIEKSLPNAFKLDSASVRAFVFSHGEFNTIVNKAPKGFGTEPDTYYYDFIFLKEITSEEAMGEFDPNPEVDTIGAGPGVIYHRRLSEKRNKSRLSRIVGKPVYQYMTIRSYTTTSKLATMLKEQ